MEKIQKFCECHLQRNIKVSSRRKYSLTSQIRRAAVSIPSNIAEGCGRNTNKDLSRYLDMSMGSCCEVETQIYIASDLNYIDQNTCKQLTNEVTEIRKMINGFKSKLI